MVTINRRGKFAWVDIVVSSYEEKLPMTYVCIKRNFCIGLQTAVVSRSVR